MELFLPPERGMTPDRFVLIRCQNEYCILAGTNGGYAASNSWRRSTAIRDVDLDGDIYFVRTLSGSEYALQLVLVGFTLMSGAIWAQIEEQGHHDVALVHEQDEIKQVLESFMEKQDANV